MDKSSNRLLTGSIPGTVVRFALPFLLASFLQSVYGAVDLLVVGQYGSAPAVSAVSVGSQLMVIATAFAMGISMGGTVRIGRRIGEGSMEGAGTAVGNTGTLFLLLAVILTPLMLLFGNTLIRFMQTPPEAVEDCRAYVRICSLGLPFIIGYNAVSAIYRGVGDSRTPLLFISIACVVNIVLDFTLVGHFGMGASGAAIATVAAQAVSLVFGLWHLMHRGVGFPVRRDMFRPRAEEMRHILKVGLPLSFQDVLVHISFMAITAMINTLGVTASAAVGVAEKLMSFAFLIPGAFSSAVATMVAQNLGAGQQRLAVQATVWGIGYPLGCGSMVALLCWVVPESLASVFSRDHDVVAACAGYIGTYSLDCILTAFVFNINAYLNGRGESMVCFFHSMVATFLVRIPLTYFMLSLSSDSLAPMGIAAPAASMASILICAVYLRMKGRKDSKQGKAA